jgi:hypothetical protein
MVLGVAILAFIGMSSVYAIFLGTLIELMLIQRFASTLIGSISPIGSGPDSLHEICQPGFNFPNMMRVSIIEKIGVPSSFPSPVMFFLSGMISYMIAAMNQFSNEISTLKGDLDTRTKVGMAMGGLLIFAMLAFRYSYGCDSIGPLLFSSVIGCIAGLVLLSQNLALFGRGGVNILNLPMILTGKEQGQPMYVCSPS